MKEQWAMETRKVFDVYLDLLDSQREAALAAVSGLAEEKLWQHPAPRERSIGEILNHNYLLIASTMPYVRLATNRHLSRSAAL